MHSYFVTLYLAVSCSNLWTGDNDIKAFFPCPNKLECFFLWEASAFSLIFANILDYPGVVLKVQTL
jgi:hypothetical protein